MASPTQPRMPGGHDRKLSGIGATEEQVDMRDTIPQRNDRFGTKIEDLAGTGSHDGSGG
jgi:hypothetical protein